jgi:hypothetical protein
MRLGAEDAMIVLTGGFAGRLDGQERRWQPA